jgi:hypothetical protein
MNSPSFLCRCDICDIRDKPLFPGLSALRQNQFAKESDL